jgi:hypothetical protein
MGITSLSVHFLAESNRNSNFLIQESRVDLAPYGPLKNNFYVRETLRSEMRIALQRRKGPRGPAVPHGDLDAELHQADWNMGIIENHRRPPGTLDR